MGHDHISATVNTLVLAYAGASLPILLVFSLADTSLGEAINFETVAEAVVGMLVGSIGLIAAVPVTTALAALLALRLEGPLARGRPRRTRPLALVVVAAALFAGATVLAATPVAGRLLLLLPPLRRFAPVVARAPLFAAVPFLHARIISRAAGGD